MLLLGVVCTRLFNLDRKGKTQGQHAKEVICDA